MFIVFGAKSRISKARPVDILQSACPSCSGNLQLSNVNRWFTLYWIPIFPYSTLESIYHCRNCKSSYRTSIKSALIGSQMQKQQVQQDTRKMIALTLAACMTHMAKIDGQVDPSEEREIVKLANKFPQFKDEIYAVVHKVSEAQNTDAVYEMLRKARTILTAEGIMVVMAQIAKVLLADGRIDPKEEQLMKEYLLICGIPRNLYGDIINRVNSKKLQRQEIGEYAR